MRYVDFYRVFGTRRISEIYTPKVFSKMDIHLPKFSTLYLFNVDMDLNTPHKDGLLNKPRDIIVKTIAKYGKDTIGNFREQSNKLPLYIKECKNNEPKLNFVKNNSFVLKGDSVLVKNFLGLNNIYKYSSNPLLPYWRFYNTVNTVVEEINKELDRNIFIPLDINNNNLKYVNFRILLEKRVTSGLLHLIPNYNTLLLFELWKFIDPLWKDKSLFNKIDPEKIKNVNLVLSSSANCAIVNLEVLLSVVAEYKEYTYKINKLPYKTYSKLLYLSFKKIMSTDPIIEIPSVGISDDTMESDKDLSKFNIDDDLDFLEDGLLDNVELEENGVDIEDKEESIINNSDIETVDTHEIVASIEDTKIAKNKKDILTKKIETLKDTGLISKNKSTTYLETINKQYQIPVKVNGVEKTLHEIINHKHEYVLKPEEVTIEPGTIVKNKDYLKNTIVVATKNYVKEDHEINIVKSLVSISNADVMINSFNVEHSENILGKTSTYKMEVTTLDGYKSTLELHIPKVEENGTYRSSNNTYIMRRQKNDLPIRKINYNEVVLNSFYGKLFVTRGYQKNNDAGYWLRNKLLKMYAENLVTNLVTRNGSPKLFNKKLPDSYTTYTRYLKSFKFEDYTFNFNYDSRNSIVDNNTFLLEKLEESGVIIGTKNKDFLVMHYNNDISLYSNNKFTHIGNMEEILNIETEKYPIEYVNIRLFKTHVPIVLLLGYYFGSLERLLKSYHVEFYYEKSNVRIDKTKYHEVRLSNDKLVFKKSKKTDLLFGGLVALGNNNTKMITRLNNKNDFDLLFNTLGYSLLVRNEVTNLNNMFIDPITMDIIKLMKLPETFPGLLTKAVEMLVDDSYENPNSITGTSLKGYERMSGMIYREICSSVRDYRNKSTFGRSKITINPYSVIKKLNEDSTTMLVNDINPIANLKQYEDVTLLGFGGLSKESVNKEKRQYDEDDIGIVSEANKDSGDVGISSYLTASPNVINKLGMVEKIDISNLSWSNIFSTSAMLAPFGINDDMKRLVFSGIQNEHVIPTINMRIPYVRTPYDVLIASRLQDKYCQVAEADGEIIRVTDKVVTVKYKKDNKEYTKDYKLYSWYSKIESNSTFKHDILSNVIKGEKVKKDDVLVYDRAFFIPDLYDKRRVVYIQSTYLKVAFIDDMDTYEDSTTLSYKTSELMSINPIKLKSIVVNGNDNIIEMLDIGTNIIPTSTLFSITNQIVDLDGLDEDAIEVLKNMNSFSPKAKYTGKVDDIVIYYNSELEDLSPTIRELVKVSDKKLLEKTGFTGKVNSSYSIKGKPLMPGEVEVRIFISIVDDMSIADKMIWGNQLKCTVGGLFKKITTLETNEEVDATFSSASVAKRITPSMIKMGVLSSIAEKIENDVISMYFKNS